jgi:hypothetical protein
MSELESEKQEISRDFEIIQKYEDLSKYDDAFK